ncbi:MAG: hypothetical protein H6883_08605 [Rhodobiaceae bacterium]|nr:hypothetical protein [Rhodobiaceae bacterium]MCC0056184.1 hypothetical protein [Rhodobiaceae bacterium]
MAITAEQYDYNVADDADYTWVETMLFPVIVPEANIYALLYNSAKPTLGCMAQQVLISGALCDTEAEMLHYYDNQHLPLPERWTNITSPEGLNIKAVKLPREFRLDYVSSDGETEVHVDWVGMMEPFDIHDPKHSPQAGNAADMHADLEIGKKHKAGHIDMTGRATGTLKVRGRTFEVDCFERMDRSWGPRQPMNIPTCYIVSATIDENLAFHMIVAWNPEKPDGQQFTMSHGYVLENGEVYGLTTDLEMRSKQHGLICTSIEMQVTDTRGKKYDLLAMANSGAPWMPATGARCYNSLMRWHHEGKIGYGVVMANYNLNYLMNRHHRFTEDPSPKIWI